MAFPWASSLTSGTKLGRADSGPSILAEKKKTAWEVKRDGAAAKLEQAKSRLRAAAYNSGRQDFRKLFGTLDKDHSAELDWAEFKGGMLTIVREKMPQAILCAYIHVTEAVDIFSL